MPSNASRPSGPLPDDRVSLASQDDLNAAHIIDPGVTGTSPLHWALRLLATYYPKFRNVGHLKWPRYQEGRDFVPTLEHRGHSYREDFNFFCVTGFLYIALAALELPEIVPLSTGIKGAHH